MMFELPINLDDMSLDPADYRAFADWLRTQTTYAISHRTRDLLLQFADWKAQAIQCRLQGSMQRAMILEHGLESTYKLIPKKWKW